MSWLRKLQNNLRMEERLIHAEPKISETYGFNIKFWLESIKI